MDGAVMLRGEASETKRTAIGRTVIMSGTSIAMPL
jgi:hypothetical protein